MGTVYAFFADGFEEIEAFTAIDTLRRGGLNVEIVSVTPDEIVVGAHDVSVLCDINFENCDFFDAELLLLPGGMPGTKYLNEYQPLRDLLADFYKKGGKVAAICAAPTVLASLGFLEKRKATAYPSCMEGLADAERLLESVVVDGNVTTSRGLGTAVDFALSLIGQLLGEKKADEIAESIVYKAD